MIRILSNKYFSWAILFFKSLKIQEKKNLYIFNGFDFLPVCFSWCVIATQHITVHFIFSPSAKQSLVIRAFIWQKSPASPFAVKCHLY